MAMAPRRSFLQAQALLASLPRAEPVDDELACEIVAQVGIWISPRLFQRLPILLPHVVRDATARGRSSPDGEQWASPNASGYLRDDNSLVKEAVKSLRIEAPTSSYDGMCIGQGWVAAHVWQFTADGTRATLDATTNSFVPNVVWLPRALARLSDVQGSRFQAQLIWIARHLYGDVRFCPRLARIVDATWAKLPVPQATEPRTLGRLNLFELNDGWVQRRTLAIEQVRSALRRIGRPDDPALRLRPSRYRAGLRACDRTMTAPMLRWIEDYLGALEEQRGWTP